MHILRLQAENVKRLRAVDITPKGKVITIGGRNGQGKSSVLDSIAAALGGPKATKDLARPIRTGEDHASATIEIEGYTIERTWTPNGTYLKVTTSNGAKFSSPQSVLDGFLGAFTFDPLVFARLSPKEQVSILVEVTGQKDVLDALEADRQAAYDRRTETNRLVKQAQAAVERMAGVNEADAAITIPSPAEVMQALTEATTQNRRRDSEAHKVKELDDKLERLRIEEGRLNDQLTLIKHAQKKGLEDRAALVAALEAMPVVDTAPLMAKINEAGALGERVTQAKAKVALLKEVSVLAAEADGLTQSILNIEQEKRAIIEGAKLPIDGLSFDGEQVLYNGVPFQQASSAEQTRVAVALAMRLNPKLRVIHIRDGSLLDKDSMETIREMAHVLASKPTKMVTESNPDGCK